MKYIPEGSHPLDIVHVMAIQEISQVNGKFNVQSVEETENVQAVRHVQQNELQKIVSLQ